MPLARGARAQSLEKLSFHTDWRAQAEHGGYYQAIAAGLYRKAGIESATLRAWCREVGWEVLLNRAGTTFRQLPDAAKANLDEDRAIALMLAQPGMIKRPVLSGAGVLLVGFKPDLYAAAKLR